MNDPHVNEEMGMLEDLTRMVLNPDVTIRSRGYRKCPSAYNVFRKLNWVLRRMAVNCVMVTFAQPAKALVLQMRSFSEICLMKPARYTSSTQASVLLRCDRRKSLVTIGTVSDQGTQQGCC